MGKIRCIILRKDRTKAVIKVSSDKEFFRYKQGIYNVDREAVNNSNPSMTPELVFVEGVPRPIGSKSSGVKCLDKQLIENFVKTASHPRSLGLEIIADYMRNPSKLILLAVGLAVLIAVLQGMLF